MSWCYDEIPCECGHVGVEHHTTVHQAVGHLIANGTPTMINTDDYLEGICAVAFTKDGEEYDQCYTWETAQTMANEGYTVIAIRNDGHMDKREIQNICNYELEVALDCFGEDHLK